jgi:hypothetical protein
MEAAGGSDEGRAGYKVSRARATGSGGGTRVGCGVRGAQRRQRAARLHEGTGRSWRYELAAAAGAVRGWRQLQGGGDGGGSAECFGDGSPGTRTTGGGGDGTPKLQLGVLRRRGSARWPGTRGPEARSGSGWLKVKECRGE